MTAQERNRARQDSSVWSDCALSHLDKGEGKCQLIRNPGTQYQIVESRARKRRVPESVHWKTGEAAPANRPNRTGATRFVMDAKNRFICAFQECGARPPHSTDLSATLCDLRLLLLRCFYRSRRGPQRHAEKSFKIWTSLGTWLAVISTKHQAQSTKHKRW